ncbi:MAG TPA: RDD family protein [Candidatus Limnocylindria bacterium]|jgi:uncharacterized RDD family membrane protein YckC|nr:RDD family protein [Candidatus Limnocylindria bacterium]
MTITAGRLEIETPDHVVLRYQLAGAGNRGFAAVADFIVASVFVLGVDWIYNQAVDQNALLAQFRGWLLLAELLVAWLYFILLEWLWNGQTLGKRLFGLRVITEDGEPAPFVAVLVRNIVRTLDFLPVFYGLGLVTIIVSPRYQRFGDLAAGTFVVRAPRPRRSWSALRTQSGPSAAPVTALRVLPGEAQRLVREYVLREKKLTPAARRAVARDIATKLRPLVPQLDIADDHELIHAVARSLRGSGG